MQAATQNSGEGAVPRHIAVIMDGNGRWAAERSLPRAMGHREGAEAVRRCVKGCISEGVEYLTLYAFSSENWKRPAEEVDALMSLLRLYIRQEIKDLNANGVRVRFIGDHAPLAKDIRALMTHAEETTVANSTLTLNIALNYGSRAEIVLACQSLAEAAKSGALDPADISEDMLDKQLYTTEMPDPDLIIRTSGEQRLSNFLLWQAAYAEFLFLECYWPDFTGDTLAAAIAEYAARERRFGASG